MFVYYIIFFRLLRSYTQLYLKFCWIYRFSNIKLEISSGRKFLYGAIKRL